MDDFRKEVSQVTYSYLDKESLMIFSSKRKRTKRKNLRLFEASDSLSFKSIIYRTNITHQKHQEER
jgi:hypothetical protein